MKKGKRILDLLKMSHEKNIAFDYNCLNMNNYSLHHYILKQSKSDKKAQLYNLN